MAVDVLLVVADAARGTVLEVALAADGYPLRRAASESELRAALGAALPALLIVDTTAPFSESTLLLADERAPATSLILLAPGLGDRPALSRAAAALRMSFGREELRRALASLTPTGCAPPS